MGKQRKYIFSYFGMFSDYIHDFDFFFGLLGVWVLRKCGKVKRNRLLFFLFFSFFWVSDLFGSKKLEATENRPIEIQSIRCRCSSLSVRCWCQIW